MVLIAFTLTHIPPPSRAIPILKHDKTLHVIGFTGLAFFTLWRQATGDRRMRFRQVLFWYFSLLTYAAFDEVTQPLAGRSCEILDWCADASGAAIGLTIVYLWHRHAIRGGNEMRTG
jgi:VanZ family protein